MSEEADKTVEKAERYPVIGDAERWAEFILVARSGNQYRFDIEEPEACPGFAIGVRVNGAVSIAYDSYAMRLAEADPAPVIGEVYWGQLVDWSSYRPAVVRRPTAMIKNEASAQTP